MLVAFQNEENHIYFQISWRGYCYFEFFFLRDTDKFISKGWCRVFDTSNNKPRMTRVGAPIWYLI